MFLHILFWLRQWLVVNTSHLINLDLLHSCFLQLPCITSSQWIRSWCWYWYKVKLLLIAQPLTVSDNSTNVRIFGFAVFSTVRSVLSCIQRSFKIDQFYDRVRGLFSIAELDKSNTPTKLNPIKEVGKGISPKLTGKEIMALARLICLILSEFASKKDENEYWKLLWQLQTLTDIPLSLTLTKSILNYFRNCMQSICYYWKKTFPKFTYQAKAALSK